MPRSGTPAPQGQVPSESPRTRRRLAAVRLTSSAAAIAASESAKKPDPRDLRRAHVAQPGTRRVDGDPAGAPPEADRGPHQHTSGPQLAYPLERELEFRPVLVHVVQPAPQALVAPIDRPIQDRAQRHELHVGGKRGDQRVHVAAVERRDALLDGFHVFCGHRVEMAGGAVVEEPVSRLRSGMERDPRVAPRRPAPLP